MTAAAQFRRVASASALVHGDIVPIEVDGVAMILYKVRDRFFAAQRRCPHQGYDLTDGLVTGDSLLCGVHGWRFDAASGAHDSSPTCLVTYPVRIVGDDVEVAAAPLPRPLAPPLSGDEP
jgi:methylamine---glutamate N-methyltransferase subunit C